MFARLELDFAEIIFSTVICCNCIWTWKIFVASVASTNTYSNEVNLSYQQSCQVTLLFLRMFCPLTSHKIIMLLDCLCRDTVFQTALILFPAALWSF